MLAEWLKKLTLLGTDWRNSFLETAPWLIILFRRIFETDGDRKRPTYYVMGAGSFLLTALHNAGSCKFTPFVTRLLFQPKKYKSQNNYLHFGTIMQ